MFWNKKKDIVIIDNVDEVLSKEKSNTKANFNYTSPDISEILYEFSKFIWENNMINEVEGEKLYTCKLKPNLNITLKINSFNYWGDYTTIGSIYLNDVEIICNRNLIGYIRWNDWVVEANKQEVYSEAIKLLEPILNSLKKEKERKRQAEIQSKVDKVGL